MQANILVLTHWSFKDALVQTYTLPYLYSIRKALPPQYSITLVTAEQEKLALSDAETATINREWEEQHMHLLPFGYRHFGIRKLLAAAAEIGTLVSYIRKHQVKLIHAFCTPAGSTGYLLSRITGARLIIDSYEPHAESMVENNTWQKNGIAYRLLSRLEKWQTRKATAVIATTAGMQQYAKDTYQVSIRQFYVKPACVDLEKFSPVPKDQRLLEELGLQEKIVCVYAGKLGGIYLREEIFDFISQCYQFWGDKFRFLMLTNAREEEIAAQVQRVGLPPSIVLSRFVLHAEVPRYLSLGDFAINPVKPVPTKRYCTSIKDGEYWAMGLPVVITPHISDDSGIIEKNNTGYVWKTLSQAEYQRAIIKINQLLQGDRESLKNRIRSQAVSYRSYSIADNIYQSIYS